MKAHMRLTVSFLLTAAALLAQTPKFIDAHVHYNGDPAFLKKLISRLDQLDGMAFLLTKPAHLQQVADLVAAKPGRVVGFGDVALDDSKALEQIDRFHQAGFRGIGEISR